MHIGIVAEGPSDLILLEALVHMLQPDVIVTRLQPEPTLGEMGSGWKGVRKWCAEFGTDLSSVMQADPDDVIDMLVIHVDCSMAHNVDASRPCPPPTDTAEALERVVVNDWLGLHSRPHWLVVATPASSSDTWIAAVLDPPPANLGSLECIRAEHVEAHLVSHRLFRRRTNGSVAKPARRYEEYSHAVAQRVDALRTTCLEAERFCAQLA